MRAVTAGCRLLIFIFLANPASPACSAPEKANRMPGGLSSRFAVFLRCCTTASEPRNPSRKFFDPSAGSERDQKTFLFGGLKDGQQH